MFHGTKEKEEEKKKKKANVVLHFKCFISIASGSFPIPFYRFVSTKCNKLIPFYYWCVQSLLFSAHAFNVGPRNK